MEIFCATPESIDDDYMVIFDELGFLFEGNDPLSAPVSETHFQLHQTNPPNEHTSPIVKSRADAKAKKVGSRRFNRAIKYSRQRSCDELVQRRLSKGETMTLYTFPSFDRSDALVYLPTSLSRHMNAGDTKAMAKLLTSHLDPNCVVTLSFFELGRLDVNHLVKMYEILLELHPDTIACSTNIVVNENKIKASIYSKFTDCKVIQKSLRGSVTDPVFAPVVSVDRVDGVKHVQQLTDSQEETEQIMALASSEQNLLIYMRLELEMTVDDFTKKVTEYSVSGRITSMHPVDNIGTDST